MMERNNIIPIFGGPVDAQANEASTTATDVSQIPEDTGGSRSRVPEGEPPLRAEANTLAMGGGGGDSGGMDQIAILTSRVDGFEKQLNRFDSKLDGIDGRLRALEVSAGKVEAKVDLLTNQIVSRLPTWWQMPAVIMGTIALLTAIYAGAKHLHLVS